MSRALRCKEVVVISWLKRCAMEGEDRLRYDPRVRSWLSRWQWLRHAYTKPSDDQARARSLRALCAAARLAPPQEGLRRMKRIHEEVRQLNPTRIDWDEFIPDSVKRRIGRAAFLKPYISEREKGVLFVSFESEWFKLFRHCNLEDFSRRYTLVIAPSGDPHNIVNYVFPTVYPATIFTLVSHPEEVDILPRVAANYVVVPLYASSWVNPNLYEPRPRSERDIDLVMVANFAKFKRHYALFKAIRGMPEHLRILLIGQDQDSRTAETIMSAAQCYGVRDRFQLLSNAGYEVVVDALCRSRASVILSRREGSCVVIAESLFADTPAALLHNAEIGSRSFINDATGRLLHDGDLAAQLVDFLAEAERYSPRAWAQEHISCFQSSARLNEIIKQHMLATGQEWTCDLAPLCWRPDPCLVAAQDRQRMEIAHEDLRQRFNIEIGPPIDLKNSPKRHRGTEKTREQMI
jgi:glycosyltransferase involved in cell wall biosynthesis